MKQILTLLMMLCMGIMAYGQSDIKVKNRHGSYNLNVSFTPQLFLNGFDYKSDPSKPEVIEGKNTGGYTMGLELERKSRNGFLLNLGFQYGMRHHDITMGYRSLRFFDPDNAAELDALGPQLEHYSGTSSYWKLRLLAGYIIPYKFLHGCNVEVKAGVSMRLYQSGANYDYYRGIQYFKNDSIFLARIGVGEVSFGNSSPLSSWERTFEAYIGLRKAMDTRYLKSICIGLEFTRSMLLFGQWGTGSANLRSFSLYHQYDGSSSAFVYAKDISIGLRISAGLWH